MYSKFKLLDFHNDFQCNESYDLIDLERGEYKKYIIRFRQLQAK